MKILLCLILLLIATYSTNGKRWDKIKSNSLEHDVFRSYKIRTSNFSGCPSFSANGVSIDKSIVKDVKVDTSMFNFQTCNKLGTQFPNYFFNFFSLEVNNNSTNNGSSDGSNSEDYHDIDISKISVGYMPTFIIEYAENNNVDGFQYGGDEILGYINLSKQKYSLTKDQVQLEGNNGKNFTVYRFDVATENNVFQMAFYISGAPINVGDVKLSAEQSKVDVSIINYYNESINVRSKNCLFDSKLIKNLNCASTGPSNNTQSRLAITSFFATKSKTIDFDEKNKNDSKIQLKNEEISAGFSWVTEASVTDNKGVTTNVKVISNTSDFSKFTDFGALMIKESFRNGFFQSKFIIHSFDSIRPNNLTHDPVLGGESSLDSSSTSSSSSSLTILLSFIVSLSLTISLLI
ncbi:hypothetical protein RB653_008303 [Dictyostelium firmibasis]|uniref:Uncharacterized protein n=1 Tax=Dictyostelium firmibasis TaxID=79012 RepID=A0AAN7YTW8_9MYCE